MTCSAQWPRAPGTYLLVLVVAQPLDVRIGSLGMRWLQAGRYAYVGSALGPGGLAGRIEHHLSPTRHTRWHIDYLTSCCDVVDVLARPTASREECAWVRRLLALPGSATGVKGFGSSDCHEGCPAHLIRLPADCDHDMLEEIVSNDA